MINILRFQGREATPDLAGIWHWYSLFFLMHSNQDAVEKENPQGLRAAGKLVFVPLESIFSVLRSA